MVQRVWLTQALHLSVTALLVPLLAVGMGLLPLREALLRDPVLGPLHHAAVAWRKARFTTLMGEDGWRGLYGRLLMTPPSRILPRSQAETIWKPWARVISTQD